MKLYNSKGFGYPVLIAVLEEHSLFPDKNYMLALPHHSFFGSKAYFDDEDMMTNSCGILEYDAHSEDFIVKGRYTNFKEATKEDIEKALLSTKCTDVFKNTVQETIKDLDESLRKIKYLISVEIVLDYNVIHKPEDRECIKKLRQEYNAAVKSLSEQELKYYYNKKTNYYDF